MAAKQPAMSPSDLPVAEVLDRAAGPRRAEADELTGVDRGALRKLLEHSLAETRPPVR